MYVVGTLIFVVIVFCYFFRSKLFYFSKLFYSVSQKVYFLTDLVLLLLLYLALNGFCVIGLLDIPQGISSLTGKCLIVYT